MPYAVLSIDGDVELVESSVAKAVDAAQSHGATDVVIDAAGTSRESNPAPKARGSLKQLRIPPDPPLRIPDSAITLSLDEAWHRMRALMPPFIEQTRTGPQTKDPAGGRAKLVSRFIQQNAKTEKKAGDAENVDVQGLSLTPYWMYADSEGLANRQPNLCTGSTEACRHSCLVFSGQNYAANWSIYSKFQKTRVLFQDPEAFGRILYASCERHERLAPKNGFVPAIRLNVLSDIPWELVFPALFDALPDLQFYDYTKVPGREPPPNYDLTFSNSGGNQKQVKRELSNGGRVAVVAYIPKWRSGAPVSRRRGESLTSYEERKKEAVQRLWSDRLPSSCSVGGVTYPVIDGDINDVRFLDPSPSIIALRWKDPGGQAAWRAPEAREISRRTKFVVEIEDFCGLWVGAVTPSEQPDTGIRTVFSVEEIRDVRLNPGVRLWGTRRAGFGDRDRRLARRLRV